MKDFAKLEEKLGLVFKDKNLLTQAFCHRSYLNENTNSELSDNERLEFLGDAVLELVVTQYLYNNYPDKSEGILTNWRASLVNAKILSIASEELGFNDFLLLSKGEEQETGKARKYILGDVFESFVGSLFLDQGYEACDQFIQKYLLVKLGGIIENNLDRDPKSIFQEFSQEKEKTTPSYRILDEWGPDHDKHFRVGVFLKDKIAEGEGSSKQEAEERAAAKALEIKQWN